MYYNKCVIINFIFIYYNMNDFIKKLMETDYYKNFTLDIEAFNLLKQLRNEIKQNYKNIQERNLTIKNFSEKIEISKGQQYFHDTIIDDINLNQNGGLNITYNMHPYLFKFTFFKLKNNQISNKKILKYVKIMISWLITCKNYETDNCVKELDITVYLSGIKKILPIEKEIIGSKHVNTAYTYRCIKHSSSITMYREEDLLKVFFHETFHTFNFDFKNNCKDKLKNVFPINSELNLFESYCETWARIINHLYFSIFLNNTDDDMNIFIASFVIESLFSFSQSMKILKYMNLTLDDLTKPEKIRENFKENSNVFSYFVITSILMMNISEYISFCKTNNINILKFKEDSVDEYIILIKKLIEKIQNDPNKTELIKLTKQKTNTAKMVLINAENVL